MQIRAVSSSGKLGTYPGISKRFSAKTAFLDLTKFDFFKSSKFLLQWNRRANLSPNTYFSKKKNLTFFFGILKLTPFVTATDMRTSQERLSVSTKKKKKKKGKLR